MSTVTTHPSFDELLDYWLHDSDAAATEALDEHLMRCDACGATLDALIALGEGVRGAFGAGAVAAVAGDAFVRRLAAHGLQVREYRLAPEGSVNCTVAPGDQVLVSRLQVPLAGVERLDLVAQCSAVPAPAQRLQDIPFDARAGEVLYLPGIAAIKQLPAHTLQVTLLAVAGEATRELGRYTFHHRPWPGH